MVATRASIDEVAPELPAELVRRTLIYSDEPGPQTRVEAARLDLEIVTPDTLGAALGEMLLPCPSPDSPVGTLPSTGPISAPTPPYLEPERTIRPRLNRDEAERVSGVEGFRYTLRLVPFFVFPYRVRAPVPHGGPGPVSEHLAVVNALTGRADFWEDLDPDFVADLEEPHERLEPSLPSNEALRLAEEAVRIRHTVNLDHTEQHDGALIIERRRVPPGPGDLVLGGATLVYLPYWYVESAEGRVVLDAVSGARTDPVLPGTSSRV